MKCPKCEEGTLGKIKFKAGGKTAHLCSFCDGLWFENERISETTGRSLRTYTNEMMQEYEDCDDQDEDHRPDHPVRNL
jgi:hypothetical protein